MKVLVTGVVSSGFEYNRNTCWLEKVAFRLLH